MEGRKRQEKKRGRPTRTWKYDIGGLLEERDKNWREMKVKAQDGKEWRKS
jgi:hypothetical protein